MFSGLLLFLDTTTAATSEAKCALARFAICATYGYLILTGLDGEVFEHVLNAFIEHVGVFAGAWW
jgi:hypothetical protein